MSVPVYRRVTGSANQVNVTSVYRHTVCNCERAWLCLRSLHRGSSSSLRCARVTKTCVDSSRTSTPSRARRTSRC